MRTLLSLEQELTGITDEFTEAVNRWRRARDADAPWEEQEAEEAYVGSCYLIMVDCWDEIVARRARAGNLQRRLLEGY